MATNDNPSFEAMEWMEKNPAKAQRYLDWLRDDQESTDTTSTPAERDTARERKNGDKFKDLAELGRRFGALHSRGV